MSARDVCILDVKIHLYTENTEHTAPKSHKRGSMDKCPPIPQFFYCTVEYVTGFGKTLRMGFLCEN